MSNPVRTRFAPSPTGSLHVGGARTALYCLLFARRHGGQFLLRIEDTDQVRSSDESTRGILRDLRWLGLQWDEGPEIGGPFGPYLQSQRLDRYDAAARQLLASNAAYEAWETPEELGAMRAAAVEATGGFRYRRRADAAPRPGAPSVVRLEGTGKDLHIHDEILGDVTVPAADQDDFVLRKADGFPTYHFAVVVDDSEMRVTHVLRGQEHLMNTAKHLALQEALGVPTPNYGHLPVIFNPSGGKMSKRDKARVARQAARDAVKQHAGDASWLSTCTGVDTLRMRAFLAKENDDLGVATAIAQALDVALPMIEVMDFRKAGYLPEALLNYLALLGWNPGDDREILSLDEMIAAFSLERVNKTAARFDPDKLTWMNGEYMRSLPLDRLMEHHDAYLEVALVSPLAALSAERRRAIVELFRSRATTFLALEKAAGFVFYRPDTWEEKAVKKHLSSDEALTRLRRCRDALKLVPDWNAAAIGDAVGALLSDGENLGSYAQPVRIAVCGGPVSPPIFETLAVLGGDETVARIDACLAHCSAH